MWLAKIEYPEDGARLRPFSAQIDSRDTDVAYRGQIYRYSQQVGAASDQGFASFARRSAIKGVRMCSNTNACAPTSWSPTVSIPQEFHAIFILHPSCLDVIGHVHHFCV